MPDPAPPSERRPKHQALLGRATTSFDAALGRPGFVDAFDEAFGGLPEAPRLSLTTPIGCSRSPRSSSLLPTVPVAAPARRVP
ncbi:hypothetical protein ACWD8L_35270 [Streptomyces sp. NPDC005133]|uniref:hypothetical protein n=1 Tax=unclassified Streptomyces TaxID=2593676 RepID=UPI0033B0274F